MRPIRSASILMPTWQGEEFLERVLAALRSQSFGLPWDVRVIDSGSRDRTLEILRGAAEDFPVPLRIESIDQVEFDHGDTRNLLAARSEGDLLVFLTQDAIPSGPDWLATLARNFEDPRVGAAYCRNLPRPDAEPLTRLQSEHDHGYLPGRREERISDPAAYAELGPQERRLLYNFNDVASAIRRELWERHPFPRTPFGEDLLMARALLEAGYTVVYDDQATVEHSHDYGPEEMRKRARVDAAFNAEWLDRICIASRGDAQIHIDRQLEVDRVELGKLGLAGEHLEREMQRAASLREAAYLGLWEGSQVESRRPRTQLLERTTLKILYVVHGFPPDTWAGTEIYTLNLAKSMVARGHECVVLCRTDAELSEAEGGPEEFSIQESEFEGLRVLRLVHRLAHRSLRDTYDHPEVAAAFRGLLVREQPDLVHFQHLLHLSAGLVEVAQEFSLPTVIHLHDYWALCARVQLIQPDGTICERNRGAGCFLCTHDKALSQVPRLERLGDREPEVLEALARGERPGGVAGTQDEATARRWPGLSDFLERQDFVEGAYRAADLRVSPSRFLRSVLVEEGGFDAHALVYSDNGMRTDHVQALEKRPDPEGRIRFGFVGSLVWYKGGEVLVDAMNELDDERGLLSVYGDFKPESDEHHARLQDLANPDRVRFHGRFANDRLSEVYAEIDVLIVPSVWFENSPITIHEAWLTRTPVIASDIGGMAEYVRDGVDGLHFRVGDAKDLARAMKRILDEPGLLGDLSKDFPPVKTLEQNAAETEFRYRSLCTIDRRPRDRTLLELRGIDAVDREGTVDVQGADMLLLRGPGSAIEFEFDIGRPRRLRVEVSLFGLGVEAGLMFAGSLGLDGEGLGTIEAFPCASEDETRTFAFEVEPSGEPRRLRIEVPATKGIEGPYLRVLAVTWVEPARVPPRDGYAGPTEPRPESTHADTV